MSQNLRVCVCVSVIVPILYVYQQYGVWGARGRGGGGGGGGGGGCRFVSASESVHTFVSPCTTSYHNNYYCINLTSLRRHFKTLMATYTNINQFFSQKIHVPGFFTLHVLVKLVARGTGPPSATGKSLTTHTWGSWTLA